MHPVPLADLPSDETSAETALIGHLGDLRGAHVAVIGGGAPDVIRALIRGGCTAVTEIAGASCPPLEPVEIVVAPCTGTRAAAAAAAASASRLLLPGGRIVLRDPGNQLAAEMAEVLRAHGFSRVSVRMTAAGCLALGERPIFDGLRRTGQAANPSAAHA